MEIQLRRGVLEVCVLKLLTYGDSYGYKIVQDMPDCVGLSGSTLYPILRRLEASQCLTSVSVEHNGRMRKYYSITPIGRKKIEEFLKNWKDMVKIYSFIEGE